MKTIVVATDFSTRSDRAIRRALLLTRQTGAALCLLHVVDGDRPAYLVALDTQAAEETLAEAAQTIRSGDGVACEHRLVTADAFEGILAATTEMAADLLVIGPHRRQILRDAFIGTTAERVIRDSAVPVLMANGMPVGPYKKVLAASDLSPCSAEAVTAMAKTGLAGEAPVILFRAVDVPEVALMMRASTTVEEIRHHVATREAAAGDELRAFAATLALRPANSVARVAEGSTAAAILKEAETAGADLVVIGTRGQTGFARYLLGSVAEAVLRSSPVDVLVVPPPEPAV